MSKRPVKRPGTPPPKQFFRSKNLRNVENKSEATCSKDPIHLDKAEKVKERTKDPYSFSSDTSWNIEDDVSTDSSWSDIESDDDTQFVDSVFINTTKTEDSGTLEFSSPEIMRFRDRDDNNQFGDSVFNSAEIEEIKIGHTVITSTRNEGHDKEVVICESTINATKTKKEKIGNPALTSTRNEGNDKDVVCLESTVNRTKKYDFGSPMLASTRNEGSGNDVIFVESVIPATKTRGSFKEKGNFIDSRCVDAENSNPQIPVGIEPVGINNFVKTPPFHDIDYEVKDEDMDVHEESLIPISLKTFVNEEDKGHISKLSEDKESPEMEYPSFHRYFENVEVNSSDIVDDVFKTSNDTSNSKMNVPVFQISSTEESQEEKWNEYKRKPLESLERPLSKSELFSDIKRGKNKRRKYVKPKNASVAENQGSNSNQKKRKSQNWWKRRKRPHQRNANKTGCNIAKYEENVEGMRASEVPLSPSTSTFTDNKGSVNIEEEGHIALRSASVTENPDSNLNQKRRKRSRRRKKNKTGSNIAKKEEHVEDLRVRLSRSTAPSDDSKIPVNVKEEGESKPKIKRQRKHTQRNKEKWNEYEKYLKSLPICDLKIKKSLSDTELGEKEKEEKSKRNNKRLRKETKMSKEEWNEYKKCLESLPICPLSKKKAFSDIKWEDNKSGKTCISKKKN